MMTLRLGSRIPLFIPQGIEIRLRESAHLSTECICNFMNSKYFYRHRTSLNVNFLSLE
jgi:hypothetical protein